MTALTSHVVTLPEPFGRVELRPLTPETVAALEGRRFRPARSAKEARVLLVLDCLQRAVVDPETGELKFSGREGWLRLWHADAEVVADAGELLAGVFEVAADAGLV